MSIVKDVSGFDEFFETGNPLEKSAIFPDPRRGIIGAWIASPGKPNRMKELKDGIRAHVRLDWNGHVHKRFRGTDADQRYATEVAVLKVLEERGCPHVPRVLEEYPDELYFVSTNCGQPADSISKERADRLFAELERDYGVRHLDPEPRNITYDARAGRFCIIDFELAEILPQPGSMTEPR